MPRRSGLILKLLSAMLLCVAPLGADVGPRPPLTEHEVSNPQDILTLKAEEVKIAIKGKTAHVDVSFDFESIPLRRTLMLLRIGFPHLKADQPYRNFAVTQSVRGSAPQKPVVTADPNPNPKFSAGLNADWTSWPLHLAGSNGAPMSEPVHIQVSYDQDLSDGRLTYVLRSGGGWKNGTIGKAVITVTTDKPGFISVAPEGAVTKGGTAKWTLENFKPLKDIVVVVKH